MTWTRFGARAARALGGRPSDQLALLAAMRRHPSAQRARYRAPCRHTITAANPYELVLNTVKHNRQCPTMRKDAR